MHSTDSSQWPGLTFTSSIADDGRALLLFCQLSDAVSDTHTQPFYGPFSGTTRVSQCQKKSSGLCSAREDNRGRHTDHPAHLHHPLFLRWMRFLPQSSHFVLAWDRHQLCWLEYPVAWFSDALWLNHNLKPRTGSFISVMTCLSTYIESACIFRYLDYTVSFFMLFFLCTKLVVLMICRLLDMDFHSSRQL